MECWIIILKMLLIYRNKLLFCTQLNSGFPGSSDSKESAYSAVWSLGWEDPLEKEMATHSSILAWKIPWTRSLAGYNPWSCKESDTTEWLHMYKLKNFNKLSVYSSEFSVDAILLMRTVRLLFFQPVYLFFL